MVVFDHFKSEAGLHTFTLSARVAIGSSEAHVAINLVNKDGNIVVELYIQDSKALLDRLFEMKDEI